MVFVGGVTTFLVTFALMYADDPTGLRAKTTARAICTTGTITVDSRTSLITVRRSPSKGCCLTGSVAVGKGLGLFPGCCSCSAGIRRRRYFANSLSNGKRAVGGCAKVKLFGGTGGTAFGGVIVAGIAVRKGRVKTTLMCRTRGYEFSGVAMSKGAAVNNTKVISDTRSYSFASYADGIGTSVGMASTLPNYFTKVS